MLFSDYVRPTLCNCLFTAPKRTSTSQWDVKPLAKAITGKYNKTVETKGMPCLLYTSIPCDLSPFYVIRSPKVAGERRYADH